MRGQMGEAFITRRGGGIPYAIIGVTYPAGSVCTCTNGTRTLTAEDTSGKAMFVIPSAGTWTVKAVLGDKTASSTVEITAEGQVETVVLVHELILFDGTDNTAVTGGLKLQAGQSPNETISNAPIADGKITITRTGYTGIYPTNKVDITKYSTLYVDLKFRGTIQYVAFAGILKSDRTPSQTMSHGGGAESNCSAYQGFGEGENSLAIPVDGLSGEQQFMLMYYTYYENEMSISKIRFA